MSVIYTAIDSTGAVHTRKSVGHNKPLYTHAVVRKPGQVAKSLVNYCGSARLATSQLQDAHKYNYRDAEIIELTAVVK